MKYRFWLIGILTLIMALGIYLMLTPPLSSLAHDEEAKPTQEFAQDTIDGEAVDQTTTTGQIIVDVAGGVNQPGVYFLPAGSIVEDGIKSAGGFNKLADLDAIAKTINRAASVESHSKIYIPKRDDNLAALAPVTSSGTTTSTTSPATSAKININTATASELDILPGVGPVTAQRIIDYRIQNGDFANIEEIKNVPGMGNAKFEQLRTLITT